MFTTGTKFSLLLLFALSLFLASQSYDVPLLELERCQIKCLGKDYNSTQEHICVVLCHDRYIQDRIARENGQNPDIEDPKKLYKQCQKSCSSRYEDVGQRQQKQLCLQHCRDEYEDQKKAPEGREKGVGEHGGEGNLLGKKKEEEKHEEKQEKNPYFFEGQKFESVFRTEEGHFRVLQRFSEKSELLNGIDQYRLAIFVANASTLLLPHHCDADAVYVITNGQAIITLVHQKRRESFNLRRGDAIGVPAGSTVYLLNHHNNQRLQLLMFVNPLNTPGHFEKFFGAGGEDPQSFYRIFSRALLRAAFNIQGDKHERFFKKQQKGPVIKLSQEQVKALSQEGGSSSQGQGGGSGSSSKGQGGGPGSWPWGEPGSSSQGQGGGSGSSSQEQGAESRGPFNVLQQPPQFGNEHGQFFEASPDTNVQLRLLGFSVAFMNIKQGAMIVPYHNTRSTVVVVVVRGKGKYEMGCPHVGKRGEKEREKGSTLQYEQISARFSAGDAFVIPTGHPISIVASEGEDLQFVGFGVNAWNNHKHFLAGSDNIWNQVPSQVKTISFQSQGTEADQIFGSQPEAYFVPGPKQSQQQTEEEKGHSVASILDFVGFM